jgi:CheY-like chemotaxis protein
VGAVALGPMLGRLRDEFAPMAARKGLQFKVLGSRAVVDSDATYLRRILQNLIGNAIRYTVSGRVLVGVRHLGGAVRVEVIDTGPGIPEGERQAIFREFHRLGARASASEGMGLGLAIVERACALLGHPLELHSGLGRGSRFAVTLPLAEGELRTVAVPEGVPALGDLIVLLVENDADLRRALALLLERWGVQVIEAASGEEALALLDEIGILPDRGLVDYRLGEGMDGLELAERLRAVGMAVRLITADRSEALRGARVGVLAKPIAPEALAAFLRDG